MNYRFVKVTSFYRDFLKRYYDQNSNIIDLSYDEQLAHLMDTGYSWADFYSKHLRQLGNEAYEIVANATPLQNTWAKEHGFSSTGLHIVLDQLKNLKPDVIMFQDSYNFNGDWIGELRKSVPSIKLVFGFGCSPFNNLHLIQFKAFDFMIVCSPRFSIEFQKSGLRVYTLLHAFEDSLLDKIEIDNPYPQIDFSFLGSFIPGSEGHTLRQQVVNQLIKSKINLDIYAHILNIKPMDLFFRRSAYLSAQIMKGLKLDNAAKSIPGIKKAYFLCEMPQNPKNVSAIRRIAKPPVYGIEMFKAISRSKIGFNMHGEAAGEYAANVRLFEITGVGSCMVTDWKKNLNEIFEIDKETVAFRSGDECIEKIKWLLEHPKERKEIAAAGQKRVLKDHTFKIRASQLNEIILKELKK
ncbi:MAG: glycosyltransferase [Ignavibacteriaceae bacterium]|nr:glycosyltransferase [Ignavibacteriaceae bacterium]